MNKSEKIFTVNLTGLGHQGDALGRLPDGRAVFVSFGLPGETVRAREVEAHQNFVRAELLEVIAASSDRVEPRCVHFTECGGCQLQHLPYELQLRAKIESLRGHLSRTAGLLEIPFEEALLSANPWNYRNFVQFHLSPQGEIGFYRHHSNKVIPIRECHLPEPSINAVWPGLEVDPVAGLQRVALRAGSEGEVLLILESDDPEPPEFSLDIPLSAVHLGPEGPVVLAGRNDVLIDVLDRSFQVSSDAFFQVNTQGAAALVETVLKYLPPALDTVLDLYCGGGLFSAFLASRSRRLIGIESSHGACDDYVSNLDMFDQVELYQARIQEALPHLEFPSGSVDLVLMDPPRAGVGRRTLEMILSLQPVRLVYVSCNPAALARDARQLIDSHFQLKAITPVDLFPQTYHLESVSYWERV